MITTTALLVITGLLASSTTASPLSPAGRTPQANRALTSARRSLRQPGIVDRGLIGDILGSDDAPDGTTYAPYEVNCPDPWIWLRNATALATREQEYLDQRQTQLDAAWATRISDLGLTAPPRTPVVASALSGGGYRAMVSGSGMALEQNLTTGGSAPGDVLALTTYFGGLSGGSWATASFYANDAQKPSYLIDNVWNLKSNLIVPDDDQLSFYYNLVDQVNDKSDAGFHTQLTDYWSLALTDHLLPTPYHAANNPNYTMADLLNIPSIQNASLPWPIIIAGQRQPGETVTPMNATVWEFTPAEWGSWVLKGGIVGGFTSVEYMGTDLSDGSPVDSTKCVKGFDNLGFIAGTSSTLFSGLATSESTDGTTFLDGLEDFVDTIDATEFFVSTVPNMFAGWRSGDSPVADLENITLVDEGLTDQNVPLDPFLISYRGVDAIIAFDNSADTTYSWPNGSALWTTYERYAGLNGTGAMGVNMPQVPSTNGFVNGGFNSRPTFFGCNDTTTPVIIYIPNYPWSYAGNQSTYTLQYSDDVAKGVLDNGARSFGLNGTAADWETCLTCAFMDNAVRENGTRSATCESCMQKWCWDGTDDTTAPTGEYEPVIGTVPAFLQTYTSG